MKKDLPIIILVLAIVIIALVGFSALNKKSNYVSFNGTIKTQKIETPTDSFSTTEDTTSQTTDQNNSFESSNNYYNYPGNTYTPPVNTYTPPVSTYSAPTYIPPSYNPPAQTFTCPNSASRQDARDMWVWHDNTLIVQAGTQTQNDFFNFVDSHKIRTIYLSLNKSFFDDSTNVSNLKTFLNTAKNVHCLNVEALSGDTSWATNISSATSWAQAIINFNNSISSGNTKLIGLQYDVEPFNSSSLSDQATGNAYIDMLQAVRNTLSGSGLIFDTAIPRWYDTKSSLTPFIRTGGATGKTLAQYVIDTVDVVSIMDYVTNASSIYNDAKDELDYASTVGKKVRLGVDTASGSSTSTFYGSSCAQMNSTLVSAYNMLSSSELSSFDGFSIEHYKGAGNTPYAYSVICP